MPKTVRVSVKGLFPDGSPFVGAIRFKPSGNGLSSDKEFLASSAVYVHLGGEKSVTLIPSSEFGAGSFYTYEIIKQSRNEERTIQRGRCVVPDFDCEFADIIDIELGTPIDKVLAELYASEAKAAKAVAERSASAAKASAESSATNAQVVVQALDELDSDIAEVHGIKTEVREQRTAIESSIREAKTVIESVQGLPEEIRTLTAESKAALENLARTSLDAVTEASTTGAAQIKTKAENAVRQISDSASQVREDVGVSNQAKTLAVNAAEQAANSLSSVQASASAAKGYSEASEASAQRAARSAATAQEKVDTAELEVTQISDALSHFKGEAENTHRNIEKQTADLQRKVANLHHLLNGVAYTEEQDSTEAYAKAVPSGAAPWAEIKSIGGRTLVWNQLLNKTAISESFEGANSFYNATDGTVTVENVSRTALYISGSSRGFVTSVSPIVNHKYYFSSTLDGLAVAYDTTQANNFGIFTVNNGNLVAYFLLRITPQYDWVNKHPVGDVSTGKIMLIDLTLMFGAGNEPSTVEEVEAIIGTGYHSYNAGEPVNGDVSELSIRGANEFDTEAFKNFSLENGGVVTEDYVTLIASQVNGKQIVKLDGGVYFIRINGYNTNTNLPNSSNMSVRYSDGSYSPLNFNNDFVTHPYKNAVSIEGTWSSNTSYVSIKDACIMKKDIYDTIGFKPERHISNSVPEAVRSLPGYGTEGTLIDVVNKKYINNGQETDISDLLPEDWGHIEVEPGGAIEFRSATDFRIPVPSTITYQVRK